MTSALDRAVEDYETGVSHEEAENKADLESIDLIREIEGVRKLGLLTKAEEEILKQHVLDSFCRIEDYMIQVLWELGEEDEEATA